MIIPYSRRIAASVAYAALAFILFATLSPIDERPHLATQGLEHIGAFLTLGLLLQIAVPEKVWRVLALLVLVTAGLEAAQHLTPDRHGTLIDFARKVIGASLGTVLGVIVNRFSARLATRP